MNELHYVNFVVFVTTSSPKIPKCVTSSDCEERSCWTRGSRVVGSIPIFGMVPLWKLRQFYLPHFASVFSAVNEYQHCWEGTCD